MRGTFKRSRFVLSRRRIACDTIAAMYMNVDKGVKL
jgi:hypothetical protein